MRWHIDGIYWDNWCWKPHTFFVDLSDLPSSAWDYYGHQKGYIVNWLCLELVFVCR